MKKARRLITSLLLFCIVTVTALAGAMTVNAKAQTGEVSRIEWLKQLTGAFNMSVEEKNYPDNYYADISSDYENYYTVMLATEFGLVDVEAGDNFRPDDAATREFAAHTMNVCMGYEPESTGYTFSESGTVTYPDDIQVAIDKGYLAPESGRFNPNKPVTSAEVQAMIAAAKAAYAETQLDDSHNNSYKFKSGVIVLPDGVNAELTDENVITITDCSVTLKTGDMFAIVKDGFPMVKKVKTVSASGNVQIVSTEEVDASDAFESIDIQGTINGDLTQAQAMSENVELSYVVGGTEENNYEDGISYYSLDDVGEEQVDAIVVNQTYDIPENVRKSYDLAKGMKAELTATISNVGADYGYDKGSAFFRMDADVTFTCNVSVDVLNAIGVAPKLELVRVPVAYIGYVKATLDLTAKGSMTFTFVEHVSMGVSYGKSGFRTITDFQKKAFTIQTRAEIGAGVTVAAGFDAVVLKGNVSCSVGGKAIATSDTYSDGKTPTTCVQMNAWMYLYWDYEVKLDLFIYKNSWKGHGDIYTQSNSPVRVSLHYEDGSPVDRCTRDGSTTAGGSGSTGGASTGKKVKYYTPINSQYGYSGLNTGTDSSGKTYTVFDYTLDGIDATITKYNGNVSALSIPSTLDGYNVVGIGYGVFSDRTELRTVIIPDSVITIDSNAFSGCTNLSSVKLSKNLKEIGGRAFYNCDALTSIEIPKSLEKGGYYDGVFADCDNLKTVTFENGTSRVASYLFADCTGLESIEIPEGVTSIDGNAFYNCRQLKRVTLPSTVTKLDSYSFEKCVSLTQITLPNGITSIESGAFRDCTNLKEIVIPDSVVTINDSAFSRCTNLSSVKLSKNLKEIGGEAFYNCDALTSIEIPKSLEKGGYYDGGVFADCDNLKTVTFENGTSRVASYLFADCTGLESIEIPEGVTSIDGNAFYNCRQLKRVTLPSTVTKLDSYSFEKCVSLTQITLPNGITSIESGAFRDCTNLKEIVIPDSVTEIEGQAFYGCTSLTKATLPNTIDNIPQSMFEDCTALASIELPETVKIINSNAFKNCTSLASVTMKNNVTRIGSYAFYNCDALTTVNIPDSVTKIDSYAFSGSDALTTVNFGAGLTEIGSYAFDLCQSLNKVVLPYSLTKINNNAFSNCTKLTEVTINRNVSTIGSNAFSYPGRLTIYGISGTYAETYAGSVGAKFVNQNVPAKSVKLNYQTLELNRNDSVKLVLSVEPANFTDEITWKSSNTDVVTVSADGTVKAAAVGKARIMVYAGNVSAACDVVVKQPVTSMSLSASSLSLDAGDTKTLTVSIYPTNADNKEIAWSSSDEKVAVVDQNGKVTAVGKGSAVISAATKDGSNLTKTCNVTVTGTIYNCKDVSELESKHNYDVNCTDSWVYTVDGASRLILTFDERTEFEENFDFLYIYDKDGAQVGKYTGKALAGKTVTVTGNKVQLKLSSDKAGTAWGFKVTKVETGAQSGSSKQNGLALADDGNWYLYADGKVASGYTGLYNDEVYGWWLVVNGMIDKSYTGLYNDVNCGWWLVAEGRVAFEYNDLYNDANYGWWLITNGSVNFGYTGLFNSPTCGWWLIGGGSVAFYYNDLWNDANCGWWLVSNGTIDFGYTGLYNSPTCGWWLIGGGSIAFYYNDLWNDANCGWWLVSNGTIDFGYTGLYNSPTCGWWLIGGGSIAFYYTDWWNDAAYGTWYINGGTIDFAHAA